VRSLRARLFAATLAALALTLALTIAIGAVLTRRQVDRNQSAQLARRADDFATQRRRDVSSYSSPTQAISSSIAASSVSSGRSLASRATVASSSGPSAGRNRYSRARMLATASSSS